MLQLNQIMAKGLQYCSECTKYEHTCTCLMILYNYVVTTWELFKRSFMHSATTYTDELAQVGHYHYKKIVFTPTVYMVQICCKYHVLLFDLMCSVGYLKFVSYVMFTIAVCSQDFKLIYSSANM